MSFAKLHVKWNLKPIHNHCQIILCIHKLQCFNAHSLSSILYQLNLESLYPLLADCYKTWIMPYHKSINSFISLIIEINSAYKQLPGISRQKINCDCESWPIALNRVKIRMFILKIFNPISLAKSYNLKSKHDKT